MVLSQIEPVDGGPGLFVLLVLFEILIGRLGPVDVGLGIFAQQCARVFLRVSAPW